MKKLITITLMALSAVILWMACKKEVSTGTIYGTVTDYATGEPVKNANVKLNPGGDATLTGSDGTYQFQDLKPGKYSLSFSKAEYADLDDDYVIELEAGKNVCRDVQMRRRIASLVINDMAGNPLDTLDFGDDESVTIKTFTIFNDGTESLTCSATYNCDWIVNVSGLEGAVQPGQTVPVSVRINREALADGENTTFLYITSGNGSNEIVVKATFRGVVSMTTGEATNVTASSATVSGNISDDGGRPVLARGICYGTSQNPDIDGEHTQDGSGTGSFSHHITGLSASTTYYARAYATNRNGTYYASNIVSFTTNNGLPTVTTTSVTEITATTAKSGGNVTGNGGYNVTERGVCWNTMGSPDLNDPHTTNGNGNGSFTSNMTNLTAGTTYHVRAYATNSMGTSYGNEVTFSTSSGSVSITLSNPTDITANTALCSANITNDGGATVTERGFCWSTSQFPSIAGSHMAVGNGTGSFSVSLIGLNPSTTYYVRAYATNAAGTSYSSQVSFTTISGLPTITTTAVTDITATTAKSGGNITNNGGFNVTARGVCWNTTGNPDISDPHTTNGNGNGSFTSNMTGLAVGTTYHVRAYATNSMGTKYGNDITFTTTGGNVVMTISDPTNITATSASCSVNITDDGGAAITERGICWSTNTQSPTVEGAHTAMGSGTGSFTASFSSLTPSTTYYVRAYTINAAGTSYSAMKSFTTTSGLPTVTTGTVSSVTATSATCSGSISDNGGFAVTARGFCWNLTGNPDVSDLHTTNGSGNGSFTGNITGLSANNTYHVRAYATNSTGTSYGSEITFTTSNGNITMTLSAPTNITATSASCSVNITDDGDATITERGICWSTAQYPTTEESHVSSGSGTGTFTASMSGLSPSTTYYVRAYAVNVAGTFYSNQVSFTTNNGLPTVSTGSVSSITATTAVCSGNVTNDGGFSVTAKGLCWSTSQYPTVSGSHSTEGSGIGSFNSSMTNLQIGTTYYVRAYSTNSVGTVYGTQVSFTTGNGLPTVTTTTPTLNGTTVSTGGNVTSDGGFPVTARGVCYGPLPYPDLTSTYSHTINGSGTGYFSSTFSLSQGSGIYYVRAYATNANGTSYGAQKEINCEYLSLPTFTFNGHTYRVAPEANNTLNWNSAINYCDNLTLHGYDDWFLPSREELLQMYNDRVSIGGFGDGGYWSSSYHNYNSYYGWRYAYVVQFNNGQVLDKHSDNLYYVRPVRIEN